MNQFPLSRHWFRQAYPDIFPFFFYYNNQRVKEKHYLIHYNQFNELLVSSFISAVSSF